MSYSDILGTLISENHYTTEEGETGEEKGADENYFWIGSRKLARRIRKKRKEN